MGFKYIERAQVFTLVIVWLIEMCVCVYWEFTVTVTQYVYAKGKYLLECGAVKCKFLTFVFLRKRLTRFSAAKRKLDCYWYKAYLIFFKWGSFFFSIAHWLVKGDKWRYSICAWKFCVFISEWWLKKGCQSVNYEMVQ